MCFSATASFSAGAVLLGIGVLTLKAARRPCEWPFAAIPLLSPLRWIQVFGALALLSFGAADYFYATWFISVGCFYATLPGTVIYLHFVWRPAERGRPQQTRGIPDQPDTLEKSA